MAPPTKKAVAPTSGRLRSKGPTVSAHAKPTPVPQSQAASAPFPGTAPSDHTTALVPIETWCYNSPDVRLAGREADIGLFAESLIYYDRILLNLSTDRQWVELLTWLLRARHYETFLSLIREGVITVFDYSFLTAAYESARRDYSVWNIQDPLQAQYGTYARRLLFKPTVVDAVKNVRRHRALLGALRDRVIEAKSEDFGHAIENARADNIDPRRNAIILQAFVDDLYHARRLGRPPEVKVDVYEKADGSGHEIKTNLNFGALAEIAGTRLGFHPGTMLTAAGVCNRYLVTASERRCDLFVGSPMSSLIGDKLFETVSTPGRTAEIIGELKERVEFPDVRTLVNRGGLSFGDVLALRKKAGKFRVWLQGEAERDRDAIIAYHHEVAKEAGFTRVGRRTLSLFGVVSGGVVGNAIGAAVAGPPGSVIGETVGAGLAFLMDLGASVGAGWKPVVFGTWMRDRIEKLADARAAEGGAI